MAIFHHNAASEQETLERSAELYEQGDYLGVIQLLESLPMDSVTPDVIADLARAYANLAIEKREGDADLGYESRDLLSHAIELMSLLSGTSEDENAEIDYLMGKALLMIDMPADALEHLERLNNARPENAEIAGMLQCCRDTMSAPVNVTPFAKRVRDSWQRFEEHEAEIRSLLSARHDDDALALANDCLYDCANFSMARSVDGSEFMLAFSPLHRKLDLFRIAMLASMAPKAVTDHWTIIIGEQPRASATYQYGAHTFHARQVEVWPEFHEEDGDFSVRAYSPDLATLLSNDPDIAYSVFVALADRTIGEVKLMRCLNGIDLLDQHPSEQSMTLLQLGELIDEKIPDIAEDGPAAVDACLDQQYFFNRNPFDLRPSQPGERADIITGVSTCPDLIDDFFFGDTQTVDDALADGIVVGYFFWPHSIELQATQTEEALFELNDEVEQALRSQIGGWKAEFIGSAVGSQYSYIDLIAWDFPAVLEKARRVLDAFDYIESAAFHALRRDTRSYALKGSYPQS